MEREDEDSPQPPDEHSSENKNEEEDKETGFVEVDPTGRYGRYDEILGKGAFKTVYRAFDEIDGMEVAWNQVRVQDLLQCPQDLDRLYTEVDLLKTLKHKNIIKFYNSWIDTKTQNVNFITEIFTSGTLRQYRKKHKHCDLKAVKNWSRQILRGLLYLHSHDPPIIHRDLKCDNIFVNGNQGEVKIGDLGLAAILKKAHAAHSVIGTPEFMAPELYEENYNELVDIYSFGMCVLEMVTFEYPYSECTNAAQIYKKVTSGKKPAAMDKVKDPDVRSFVEKCLASASMRLPARELLMDPFLNDGDSIDILNSIPRTGSKPEEIAGLATIAEEPTANRSDSFTDSIPDQDRDQASAIGRGTADGNLLVNARKFPSLTDSEGEIESCSMENQSLMNENSETRKSGRDFTVKGKIREEDDTVHLRLRIADSLGQTRNIHFPFNIHADTALNVAKEMVSELELSYQDVTTIAEMIDREILQLYPDWMVELSIDGNVSLEMESEIIEASATGNTTGSGPDADTADMTSENVETVSSTTLDGEDSETMDNQDSLASVQSTDSMKSSHQRDNSFQLQDELYTGSIDLLQGSALSPTTKAIAASLPNMPLERATFHGRFWENPDDALEAHSSSSDENSGGNLGEEGDKDEKEEYSPRALRSAVLESNRTQKKSYAMAVKTNAANEKDKPKYVAYKYVGSVHKSNQVFPQSPEIKPSPTRHLTPNLPMLDVQKAFQGILQPIAPRGENHVKLNGNYQHSVVVQVSLNQGTESGDFAVAEVEDPELDALMEKLNLEREREMRDLEEKYKKLTLELLSRPSKQRKSDMPVPPTRTIGFDVDTVTSQEPLTEMNPLIHSVS